MFCCFFLLNQKMKNLAPKLHVQNILIHINICNNQYANLLSTIVLKNETKMHIYYL